MSERIFVKQTQTNYYREREISYKNFLDLPSSYEINIIGGRQALVFRVITHDTTINYSQIGPIEHIVTKPWIEGVSKFKRGEIEDSAHKLRVSLIRSVRIEMTKLTA